MQNIDMIGIYCIRNTINNKVYIGQSNDIKRRWRGHRYLLNKNQHPNNHLQSAWNLYGKKAFEFCVLQECKIDELNDLEKHYIEEYNATDDKYGYCLKDGGKENVHLSEETKEKIRIACRGRKLRPDLIENLRRINTGRPLTEEHKRKIGDANRGRKNPHLGYNNKKIRCINTGDVFNSIQEASLWCGLKKDSSHLGECAKGKVKYAGRHPITNEKLSWEYA